MRQLFIAIFIFFSTVTGHAAVDLVFDLDWTLFYTTTPAAIEFNPNRTYEYDNKLYRMTDSAPEILLELQKQGFQISFFSGGKKPRNEFLVQKIVELTRSLPGGPLQVHKILSFDDLSTRPHPASDKFADKYYKDLSKVTGDLNSVVLVDDMKNFSAPGQEKNMIWLEHTYDDWPTYEWGKKSEVGDKDFRPPSKVLWKKERNKLSMVLNSLLQAKKRATAASSNFIEALNFKPMMCQKVF